MPRRLQSERDTALSNVVTQKYIRAANQRGPRVTAWDDSYQRHDPSYLTDAAKSQKPPVKFPYLHRVTSMQTNILMNATDANGRWAVPQPMTPGFRDTAEAVGHYLESVYRWKAATQHDNNRTVHKRVANTGLKYGDGFIHVGWNDRDGVAQWTYDDIYDTYLDASFGDFIIIRRTLALSKLMDLAISISSPVDPETGLSRDDGRAVKAAKKVERFVKQGMTPGFIYDPSHDVHGNSRRYDYGRVDDERVEHVGDLRSDVDPFNAPVSILEYYETHPEGIIAKIVPSFGPNAQPLVIQSEKNPYGICPIAQFQPDPIDNEFYGIGNGEKVGKIADIMDYMMRGGLAVIAAGAWPALKNRATSGLRRSHVQSVYGKVLKMRQMDDLEWMAPVPTNGLHQLGQQIGQQAADFVLGENPQRRGQVGGADTATEAAIAETASTITDNGVFREWKDTNEHLAQITLAVTAVHMTEPQMVPILGRNAEAFLELRPEVLKDTRWAVAFGGNPRGLNSTQMVTRRLNYLQSLAPTGVLDIREVARDLYLLDGEREPDRFLLQKDPVPSLSPEKEHENLIKFNQAPVLSERDNHIEHFQKHEQFLAVLAEEVGPEHPYYKTLFLHSETQKQIAIQQLLAQQGLAAGGPQGPGLFGDQSAGGNGQPASAQPSTEGIDQLRQTSNFEAAGQAPGAGAPNRNLGGAL